MTNPPSGPFHHRRTLRRFLLLALLTLTISLGSSHAFRTIVIDAGHGGKDPGAMWYGIKEKTLTLEVAKRVERILRSKGIATAMTRRTDSSVSIDQRAAIANKYKDSLFVSIHFNAHRDRTIKGIETFYASDSGRRVADKIQKNLAAKISTRNRGIKKGNYAVLLRTKSTAVLVEGGFISNAWECGRCKTDWYQELVAQSIAKGILEAK